MIEQLPFFSISFYKISIPNWQERKQRIKDIVGLNPEENRIDICYSDYFKYNNRPPYLVTFVAELREELSYFLDNSGIKVEPPEEWQMWSQMYVGADSHPLHNHGFGNLSAILYLDFDKEHHQSTRFYSPLPNPFFGTVEPYQPEVNEGDIILFPSTILHECPPSYSDIPRSIVAFNIPIADQNV